jgi:hypothetical protein
MAGSAWCRKAAQHMAAKKQRKTESRVVGKDIFIVSLPVVHFLQLSPSSLTGHSAMK